MIYSLLFLLGLITMLLFLYIPHQVTFYVDDKYVEVYIYKIRIFKSDFSKTADYAVMQALQYRPKWSDIYYLKLTRKIKFDLFSVNIGHIIEDFSEKNHAKAQLHVLFALLRQWFPYNNYKVIISDDNQNYFAFRSIFRFRVGKILMAFFSLRRKINARTSNK